MRARILVFITLLAVCHLPLGSQTLTKAAPTAQGETRSEESTSSANSGALPDDPGQEMVPVAEPEPPSVAGTPVEWEAKRQQWAGDKLTLTGDVVIHYRDYVIRADSAVYDRATTELEADGHLQVAGGPNDVLIDATHGDMRLNMHTARYYNVSGSQGVRTMSHTVVYTTTNPLLFSGRVLLQTGEGSYRIVDGSITNCRLPHPDWRIIAHTINLENEKASTSNAFFEFLGIPIFYLPYLHHPVNETGRTSGLLTPVISNGSSIRGYTFGEQVYWVINRSMDAIVGAEYYSKRGWAPNGDFRYKGPGLDHLIARWNALLDRGVEEAVGNPLPSSSRKTELLAGPVGYELVNQGGVDVAVQGRQDFSPSTRVSGAMEYLSSYVYRLVFDDNYSQAISSEVSSEMVLTHNHNGMMPSVWLDRFESYDGTTLGDEVKILRLPLIRYDVLDRPLGNSIVYWGLGSSVGYLNRAEPFFHSRNVGRLDVYPHLSMPFSAGGWSLVPEVALRDTFYTISETPQLTGPFEVPRISHSPLNRKDVEASLEIRPPALERDFELPLLHRELRHVIEPELNYRYVSGIGAQARDVLLFDTTDLATNVNEAGFSLMQRFYLRPTDNHACAAKENDESDDGETAGNCPDAPREWASWEIAQEYFIDPNFGGALIPNRRNVFDATLDLMAPTFLTSPRNVAPIVSRIRFEAIDNLRIQWDMSYDTIRGQMAANDVFAGYSFGKTTLGIGHALLNAPDEMTGPTSGDLGTLKSQQIQPFMEIGKPSGNGFNLAVNGGYDFVGHDVQYAGVQAVYNWNC